MAVLNPPAISSERFHWDLGSNLLSAEASDLGDLRLGRVYDDACDVGFTLVSHKTGKRFVCAEHEAVRDPFEGELLYTDYRPISATFDLTVRIYND